MKKLAKGADTLESIEGRIGEMERKLDRLRGLYESFFMGVERAPPNVARRDMNRLILEMQQEPISNASLRFRFQSVMQRWVLMTAYWNRTLREIESGVGDKKKDSDYLVIPDRAEAIAAAIDRAREGDTVVLCGKGHETSIIVGEAKRPWDEAGAARTALAARRQTA